MGNDLKIEHTYLIYNVSLFITVKIIHFSNNNNNNDNDDDDDDDKHGATSPSHISIIDKILKYVYRVAQYTKL